MTSEPHLMLFDLYTGGHHGQYIQQIVRYWAEHARGGRLTVSVPDHFLSVHADLVPFLSRYEDRGVALAAFPDRAAAKSAGYLSAFRADLADGKILEREVERVQPDHCIILYLDSLLLPLAAGLRFPLRTSISGIYFRPSFHYGRLGGARPTWKEMARDLAKRVVLERAVRNPNFSKLFSLDPFVLPAIHPPPFVEVVALPDGIESPAPSSSPEEVRRAFGVDPDRKLLLLLGALDRRKGYLELLDAVRRLPDDVTGRMCILIAGSVNAADRDVLPALLASVRETTAAQLILHDAFVSDAVIDNLFQAADLALIPYQRHVGSSGILVRAAHAGIPVLGSDYGLLGALIRERRLGLSVDASNPARLAEGLAAFMSDPGRFPFDAESARRFASENTADRQVQVLLSHVGVPINASSTTVGQS